MKFIKMASIFIIFYFFIVAFNSMIQLAQWLSVGNEYIEIGFYIFMGLLFLNYIIRPWIGYIRKPSMADYTKMFDGDEKKAKRIKKYLQKHLTQEERVTLTPLEEENLNQWVRSYLDNAVDGFNVISRSYAFKVSSAVLFSPNAFLDGITILYGNASMVYTLSKKVHIRYNIKDLWEMYFSIMSVASISGLIEEYDDFIIDMMEELLEDLSEKMGEEAGKTITEAIPIVNLAAKTMSFLIQSAGNYAYLIYNGRRFKKMIQNVYVEERLSKEDINSEARKEARKSKLSYVKELGQGITNKAVQRKKSDKKTGKWRKRFEKKTD